MRADLRQDDERDDARDDARGHAGAPAGPAVAGGPAGKRDASGPDPAFFAAIVATAPVGVLISDAAGRIHYVNKTMADLAGTAPARLLGRDLAGLLPDAMAGPRRVFVNRAGAGSSPGGEQILRVRQPDGRDVPVEIWMDVCSEDHAGCRVMFVTDMSRRRLIDQRFRQLVLSLPFGLLLAGEGGRIEMTNPMLDRMFGYPPGALVGTTVETLLPPDGRSAHVALRQAFFAEPEPRPMGKGRDLWAHRQDGSEFPVEIGLTPIETEEGRQVVAAVTDNSWRKHQESVLHQANEQLEEFIYVASHDLRSPLRGIGDLLSWIREDLDEAALSETVRRNFDRAQLRVRRAEQLIEDLLAYARAGQRRERQSLVNPAQLVEDVLALLTVPSGFKVEIDVPATPIHAAATPLSAALRNLIGNAFKHHGGDRGLVRIALRIDGTDNLFTVEDDGAGVPADAEERIFKLFQRSRTSAPGDGVGLAITRRMVESHGGSVTLDRAGRLGGACFRLRWPRFQLQESEDG